MSRWFWDWEWEWFWWAASWWLVWNRDVDKDGWRHSVAYFLGQFFGLVYMIWLFWDLIIFIVKEF